MTTMAPQPPFHLLGCDFSSSPTRRKPIVLALGQRQGARVALTALQPIDTLAAFGQWLAQPGDWVGGFDLPFGLPRELVQALGWPTDWNACMQHYRHLGRAQIRDDGNQYWGRIPGTPYDRMTLDWVESQFRSIGLQDVRQQEVALDPLWYPASWKATYTVDGRTVDIKSVYPVDDTVGTSPQGVDAEAVWVGLGTPADYKGRDVKGKAVFLYSFPTPGGKNHTADWSGAMKYASDAGAASIFVVMGIPGDTQANPEGAGRQKSPTVTISTTEADALRSAIEKGGTVSVHLTLNVEHRQGLKSANVWGVLPGRSDEQVVVMAHTDAFFDGALDNASGIASMLAIARHYAAIPRSQRKRTVVFLTTPDHHHGAAGIKMLAKTYDFSKTALIANCEHPSQTLLYWLNQGMMTTTAVSARRWYAGGSPALFKMVKDNLRISGVATYRQPEAKPGGELQHVYKLAPSFEIIDHVTYHTTLDTTALVPETGLEEATRAYLRIIDAANRMSLAELGPNPLK